MCFILTHLYDKVTALKRFNRGYEYIRAVSGPNAFLKNRRCLPCTHTLVVCLDFTASLPHPRFVLFCNSPCARFCNSTQVRGHPNIAGMLGICGTTVVSGFYPTPLTGVMWAPRPEPLPAAKVVSMALDAARGLQAIHEASIAPIVQFDMKPHQLLVAEDGRVMLNDFNAAQFMGTRPSGAPCPMQRSAAQVTLWQAPEHIAGKVMKKNRPLYTSVIRENLDDAS